MILMFSSVYFVIIAIAAASTRHPRQHDTVYEEISNTFKILQTHTCTLISDELFLHDYKQTFPPFDQQTFNISVSEVSMRDFHKKASITYDDLIGTCLYGDHFLLGLPSKTNNAIEFYGDIKANYYPFAESKGTFVVTYDGVKFHLTAGNRSHIHKSFRFENSKERLDIPLHIQFRNEEFKKQLLEPMIYEKFTEWIDGNEPLHSIISHCFNQHRSPQSSEEPYQIQVSNYTVSISGLLNLEKVFFANDGSTFKMELHTSSLNCTIKQTDGPDTMPSNPKIQCAGLRIYKDINVEYGNISRSRKIKIRATLKDFDITETPVSPEPGVFDRNTVRTIRNQIQEYIREVLLRFE